MKAAVFEGLDCNSGILVLAEPAARGLSKSTGVYCKSLTVWHGQNAWEVVEAKG